MKIIYENIPRTAFNEICDYVDNNEYTEDMVMPFYNGNRLVGKVEIIIHSKFSKHLVGLFCTDIARIVAKHINKFIDGSFSH